MRLLRLQSVMCLCIVTTIVMTANVPEYSKGSVTDDDTEGSKRQFSAVADTISDAWARLVVNPVMNAWRMATGIDTPGLLQYCEAQARHGP